MAPAHTLVCVSCTATHLQKGWNAAATRVGSCSHFRACHVPPSREVKEAFGEAYGEVAAARAGKRHKRSGNTVAAQAAAAAAAAAADPVRARVEQILAASAPAPPVQDGVKHEQI